MAEIDEVRVILSGRFVHVHEPKRAFGDMIDLDVEGPRLNIEIDGSLVDDLDAFMDHAVRVASQRAAEETAKELRVMFASE